MIVQAFKLTIIQLIIQLRVAHIILGRVQVVLLLMQFGVAISSINEISFETILTSLVCQQSTYIIKKRPMTQNYQAKSTPELHWVVGF